MGDSGNCAARFTHLADSAETQAVCRQNRSPVYAVLGIWYRRGHHFGYFHIALGRKTAGLLLRRDSRSSLNELGGRVNWVA